MHPVSPHAAAGGFEIRFQSLFHSGRALSFPCDAEGRVRVDALSERARRALHHAQALVGREYATPAVLPADCVQAAAASSGPKQRA